jgi:hypothetical protein
MKIPEWILDTLGFQCNWPCIRFYEVILARETGVVLQLVTVNVQSL